MTITDHKKLQPRDISKPIAFFTATLLLFPLWHWYRTKPTAGERVIGQYYAFIESRMFDEAWDLIHRARKQEVSNTIRDARDFQRVYETTLTHQDIRIGLDKIVGDQ